MKTRIIKLIIVISIAALTRDVVIMASVGAIYALSEYVAYKTMQVIRRKYTQHLFASGHFYKQ